MTRFNSGLAAVLAAALLIGAAAGVQLAPRAVAAADVVVEDTTKHANEIVRVDDAPTAEATEAFALQGVLPSEAERQARDELWAEWERLNDEREQLLERLQEVHEQMRAVAEQLWQYEMEDARARLRERLNQLGAVYGDDIVEWLPPRMVEQIAELTGRTPDEVRKMLREGDWGELL